MKRLSMLLIPCIAISANAATFNAQGKTINSNDAKNPDIVKFEKNKAVMAKSNTKKTASLAKAEIPAITHVIQVTPYEGRFSTSNNSYSLKVNGKNKNVSSTSAYIQEINDLEFKDAPRNNNTYADHFQHYTDNYYKVRSNGENTDCRITSTSYNYNAFFNYVYADILNGLHFNNCTGSGTCGNGINIYNSTVDNAPITLNGNSCKDNQSILDYAYRIQHYNINQFLATASPNATLYTVSEDEARRNGVYLPSGHYPSGKGGFNWNFFTSSGETNNAPHVGNIVSSSRKDVSSYTNEAAAIDEYIYFTRSIQFAAYTEEGKKTGTGTSLNAITVSPANVNGYVLNRDVVKSARFHPTAKGAGIKKPDIYSLSYGYNSYNDFSRKITHDDNESDILGITDSWGASTTAAAMAADLLSKYPFYKWHPELFKALMKTANNRVALKKINHNNINEITSSNITTGSQNMSDRLTSFEEMLRNNVSRYWYGNNNNFFSNEKMSFTENVDRGGKYNIAIAWLVQGRYAWDNKLLSSNYSFEIYDDATGTMIAETTSQIFDSQSTLRYKEIDIPSNVSRIRVDIIRHINSGDRVILGFNMHKVTQ